MTGRKNPCFTGDSNPPRQPVLHCRSCPSPSFSGGFARCTMPLPAGAVHHCIGDHAAAVRLNSLIRVSFIHSQAPIRIMTGPLQFPTVKSSQILLSSVRFKMVSMRSEKPIESESQSHPPALIRTTTDRATSVSNNQVGSNSTTSSFQDGICALGKAHDYAFLPVSQKFPQLCF